MADFKYVELISTGETLLHDICTEICNNYPDEANAKLKNFPFNSASGETEEVNTWELVKTEFDTIKTTQMKSVVLECTTKIGTSTTKKFYVKLTQPYWGTTYAAGVAKDHSTLRISVFENYDPIDDTFDFESHTVTYEWADENFKVSNAFTDRTIYSPIYVYLNLSRNRIAMCLVGDPAVHFQDYKKSFMYVGAIKPFKDLNEFDVNGNFLLTAGSVSAEPTAPAAGDIRQYGMYASYGNTTLSMFRTRSGILHQRHYPAFITQAPDPAVSYTNSSTGTNSGLELEVNGFNASIWTKKYHLSPIYVVHPYDGYRGSLENVIAVSKNNILHQDELIVDVTGKTWKQEVYKYFDHNTTNSFMNKSANVRMGLAILKEVRY